MTQTKIIFKPAIMRTMASNRRSVTLPNRRLPYSAPIYPPTIAAPAQIGMELGKNATLERCPIRPAIELAKINAADTPDVCRVSAQPINSNSVLKNIPPPMPVSPESNPMPTPEMSANQSGNVLTITGAVA